MGSPIKMGVPPRDHNVCPLLPRGLPPIPNPAHTEVMVVIQATDSGEEEIKSDNVCGSDESMLPDTQWVLFKCF